MPLEHWILFPYTSGSVSTFKLKTCMHGDHFIKINSQTVLEYKPYSYIWYVSVIFHIKISFSEPLSYIYIPYVLPFYLYKYHKVKDHRKYKLNLISLWFLIRSIITSTDQPRSGSWLQFWSFPPGCDDSTSTVVFVLDSHPQTDGATCCTTGLWTSNTTFIQNPQIHPVFLGMVQRDRTVNLFEEQFL